MLDTINVRHLERLSDEVGIFEHATLTTPNREEGYCLDDAGRLAGVASRIGVRHLAETGLGFCEAAYQDERFVQRRSVEGIWSATSDDATGRALWGLGVLAAGPWADLATRARRLGDLASAKFASDSRRSWAYAVVGRAAAGDVELAMRYRERWDSVPGPWYESELRYANALLCEADIAAGRVLGDAALIVRGIKHLRWLATAETRGRIFSFTPTGGRSVAPNVTAREPAFDQQPIEAGTMAEAGLAAAEAGAPWGWKVVSRATKWFEGANDTGMALADEVSGGCYDGLGATAVNQNQGAESTLALVSARWATGSMKSMR